jgi:hypothetical protein
MECRARHPFIRIVGRHVSPSERRRYPAGSMPIPVVDGPADPLLAAEVAFSCLDRDMPAQELNLVQFSARRVA